MNIEEGRIVEDEEPVLAIPVGLAILEGRVHSEGANAGGLLELLLKFTVLVLGNEQASSGMIGCIQFKSATYSTVSEAWSL